jgi:hypothetical protein
MLIVAFPIVLGIVVFAAGVVWWSKLPSALMRMRAAVPDVPTIAGLSTQRPILVPGLEKVYWLSSPTLSDDLTTLVYLSVIRAGENADLYITQRSSIDEPFGPAALIESCASPGKEAYPALSADGLELIYTILGSPSRLMYTRRSDIHQAFGPPHPLKLEGEDLSDLNLDGPQFIGPNKIRFATSDIPFTHRTQWVAERAGPDEAFRTIAKLPFQISWPRYFVSDDGRRAYYPSEDGIFLTAFDESIGEYLAPEKFLSIATTGPLVKRFDSTIWVAPKEDLIVYCSPGVDPGDRSHRIWMMQVSGDD